MTYEVLKSSLDASVNFVQKIGPGEALEARYVRRHEGYVACYLSSQTGCEQACRFCHLTATGQNKISRWVEPYQIEEQARVVLNYYTNEAMGRPAEVVHYNFMARGDFFANPLLLKNNQEVFDRLNKVAEENAVMPRFLLSTILPDEANLTDLKRLFYPIQPEIYYSLYSMNPEFRRRWLPKAMDPDRALEMLTDWQRYSKKIIRIHYALIKGQNDSLEDAHKVVETIKKHGLRADFTLVRYNPPKAGHSEEADNYEAYMNFLRSAIDGVRVKSLNRVGPDVAASCGQFINVK